MSKPLQKSLCDTCKYKHAMQALVDEFAVSNDIRVIC